MGLFDKKFCDICGEKIGFLGNKKLADGNLCRECAGKLSPLFRERRSSTTEEIRTQLAYREENAQKLKEFQPDMVFGTDEKVYLDLTAKRLIVTSAEDFREDNPDIIEAAQILSCEKVIEDNEEEIFLTDSQGNEKSYSPPRYTYAYEFHLVLKVDSPWFDEIDVDLNNGERPDDRESDRYAEQSMQMSELYTRILEWIRPVQPGEVLMGPDVYVTAMQKAASQAAMAESWQCECGTRNTGKFCTECGKARP